MAAAAGKMSLPYSMTWSVVGFVRQSQDVQLCSALEVEATCYLLVELHASPLEPLTPPTGMFQLYRHCFVGKKM
jgi:hypothetical protein